MSELLGKQTLILNSNYQPMSYYPLSTNSIRKVMKSVLNNRVNVLEEYPETIKVSGSTIHLPKVVVLKKFINIDQTPKFTRNNLYLRDLFTCQYCGNHFDAEHLTFDHLVPKVKGGKTSWDNIVTACNKCNCEKGCKTLKESGMKLLNQPFKPNNRTLLNNLIYLNNKYGDYEEKLKQLELWNNWLGI